MLLWEPDIRMDSKSPDPLSQLCTKVFSQWVNDLNSELGSNHREYPSVYTHKTKTPNLRRHQELIDVFPEITEHFSTAKEEGENRTFDRSLTHNTGNKHPKNK